MTRLSLKPSKPLLPLLIFLGLGLQGLTLVVVAIQGLSIRQLYHRPPATLVQMR